MLSAFERSLNASSEEIPLPGHSNDTEKVPDNNEEGDNNNDREEQKIESEE